MSSPIGIRLNSQVSKSDPTAITYTVGPLLSRGAFGAVHEVIATNAPTQAVTASTEETTTRTNWVVKLTLVPPPSKSKSTKKQSTPIETSYRLLQWENLLYGQHYPHLCGTILPSIPRRYETHGLDLFINNASGYRCLVMERMDGLLYDAIPAFVQSCGKAKSIDVGPIAIRLINIVEAIHKRTHILIDIKPDNIMVHNNQKKKSSKMISSPDVFAETIRLVDLGLLQNYRDPNGLRPNEGISDVHGTPLYASLNVHDLNTPSRRDDVEAMLYLIGEFIIRVNALVTNTVDKYSNDTYLPWSVGQSDEEVGNMKKEQVSNLQSVYYQSMPHDVARTMKECWDEVRSYIYDAAPKYSFFYSKIATLSIPVPAAAHASTKTRAASKNIGTEITKRTPGRKTRSSAQAPVVAGTGNIYCHDRNESPLKQQKLCIDDVEDMDVEDDGHDVDGSFHTAPPSVAESFHSTQMLTDETMLDEDEEFHDVENTQENACFSLHKDYVTTILPGQQGIKLVLSGKENQHLEIFFLISEDADSIVFGSKATPTNDNPINTVYVSVDDSKLKPSHLKLSLSGKRSVTVVDLSQGLTFFSLKQAPRAGPKAYVAEAKVGQVLYFGDHTLEVMDVTSEDYTHSRRFQRKDENVVNKCIADTGSDAKRRRSPRVMASSVPNVFSETPLDGNPTTVGKAVKKKKSMIIVINGIPGEWILQEGGCTSYIVGSAPLLPKKRSSFGSIQLLVLPDTSLFSNHARLDFQISHGTAMVNVTNLTKVDGSVKVSERYVPAGKSEMGFSGFDIKIGNYTMLLK